MSEYERNLPTSEDPEWVGLVLDVENRFEALNEALADLRSAVIRLSSYRPKPQLINAQEATDAVAAMEDAVSAFEAAATVPESPAAAPMPAPAVTELNGASESNGAAPVETEDDAARREEVARMVAEMRHEPLPHADTPPLDSWAAPHDEGEVDSTSEGSWPMARPTGTLMNPPSLNRTFDLEPRAELQEDEPAAEMEAMAGDEAMPAVDADEARREEVARMVAEMKVEAAPADADVAETEAAEEEQGGDAESRREDVARMVAELRTRMSSVETEAAETPAEPEDESRRENVADMVARMRAEMMAGGAAEDVDADDVEGATAEQAGAPSEEDVRDEVRRAVEAAKAEMAAGWVKEDEGSGDKPKFSFPDWQTAHMEPSGPPVIVIKDPEGRVELARVYETLSQVNCDENAALLNYTPHSVTVGLNLRASVPSKEAMEKAIETVFGRKCRVESDGVRVSVDIGMGKEDAA
ncbi:MAG TPA: hypothetical protein VIB47_10860 [Dehalococcoidia bacterium]|jgi:hypothetical protein